MKMKKLLSLAVFVSVLTIGSLAFGSTGIVIECPEIPDGVTVTIDGELSDWAWAADYAYTEADLTSIIGDPVPASDFSCVFNVAWSDAENMIYIAAAVTDDIYSTDADNWGAVPDDDNLHFMIDADMSGGIYQYGDAVPYSSYGAQEYYVNPAFGFYCYGGGGEHDYIQYIAQPPLGEGATKLMDPNVNYEVKVTPFDNLGPDVADPSDDVVHDLTLGETIGLSVEFDDADSYIKEGATTISRDNRFATGTSNNSWYDASSFSSAVLLPAPEVEPVSLTNWGSIKALFK